MQYACHYGQSRVSICPAHVLQMYAWLCVIECPKPFSLSQFNNSTQTIPERVGNALWSAYPLRQLPDTFRLDWNRRYECTSPHLYRRSHPAIWQLGFRLKPRIFARTGCNRWQHIYRLNWIWHSKQRSHGVNCAQDPRRGRVECVDWKPHTNQAPHASDLEVAGLDPNLRAGSQRQECEVVAGRLDSVFLTVVILDPDKESNGSAWG